jgi:hypothetical protein
VIPAPAGWRRTACAGATLFVPPEGNATGWLRYRERVAPLADFAALVAGALAEVPEWRLTASSPRESLTTAEGEHAFLIALDGELSGRACRRFVAAVYGDDFANVIDLVARDAERAGAWGELARTLVHDLALGLGVRPRRFFYRPPAGWQGLATGLVANWYPLAFPSDATTLAVYPANPIAAHPDAVFAAVLDEQAARGLTLARVVGPEPFVADEGLTGRRWQIAGTRDGASLHRELVVLHQPPFIYTLHLDSAREDRLEAHRETFLAVARSARAVPAAGARRTVASDGEDVKAFQFWSG